MPSDFGLHEFTLNIDSPENHLAECSVRFIYIQRAVLGFRHVVFSQNVLIVWHLDGKFYVWWHVLWKCDVTLMCNLFPPCFLLEGELHPGVNSDDSLNPFVLRRPSKLPDTAHALVDVQSHVPPTSPSSSGHSLQMRGRSGPPDQAEPPTLVPAVPSLETASMTPNKSSCQRVHPSQMGWFGPPAVPGVAKSEESQNLWAEVKAKSSPFQLRSPVPGPNLQPIDATHSVGIAPVQDPMRNPFAVAQAAGERPRVWRTRSSDSHTFVADVKTESQTRSAPISGSDLGFYFPGKERIEFYLPQIKVLSNLFIKGSHTLICNQHGSKKTCARLVMNSHTSSRLCVNWGSSCSEQYWNWAVEIEERIWIEQVIYREWYN